MTRSPSPIHYEHRPRGNDIGGAVGVNLPPPPIQQRGNYERRYNGGDRSRSRSPVRPYYQNDYNRRPQRQYSRSPSPRGRPYYGDSGRGGAGRGGYGGTGRGGRGNSYETRGGYGGGRDRSLSPRGRPYYGGGGGGRDNYQAGGYRRDYSRSPSPYRRPYTRRPYSSSDSRHPHFIRRPNREVFKGTEEDRLASTTLFVGNIPFAWVEKDVLSMFGEFGPVSSVSIPENRHSMRNKGFCFVHFENKANAEEALARYHEAEVEGRKLRIDWDVGRDRKESSGSLSGPPPPPHSSSSSSMHYGDQGRQFNAPNRSPSMERF